MNVWASVTQWRQRSASIPMIQFIHLLFAAPFISDIPSELMFPYLPLVIL
jgi:hypothetical protein